MSLRLLRFLLHASLLTGTGGRCKLLCAYGRADRDVARPRTPWLDLTLSPKLSSVGHFTIFHGEVRVGVPGQVHFVTESLWTEEAEPSASGSEE